MDQVHLLAHSSCLDFNLDGYRSKLDETGLQVANNQSASLEHKRALAEKTKGMQTHARCQAPLTSIPPMQQSLSALRPQRSSRL